MQKTSAKVPFTAAGVAQCMCPTCPVQSASACIRGKVSGIQSALKKSPLDGEDIPGLYCSTGTATCRDVDPDKNCICGVCAVFLQYDLGTGTPPGYFCRDGNAR